MGFQTLSHAFIHIVENEITDQQIQYNPATESFDLVHDPNPDAPGVRNACFTDQDAERLCFKSMVFLSRADTAIDIDSFQLWFTRFVKQCFGREMHCDLLDFEEHFFFSELLNDSSNSSSSPTDYGDDLASGAEGSDADEDIRIVVVRGLGQVTLSDYMVFLEHAEREGLVELDLDGVWRVELFKRRIFFHPVLDPTMLEYVWKKSAVSSCFVREYARPESVFSMHTDATEHENDILSQLHECEDIQWIEARVDTETKMFDTLRNSLYQQFLHASLFFIKGSTGCSKTVTVTKILKRYLTQYPDRKVLFISNRILYADSMETTLGQIKSWDRDSGNTEYAHIQVASYTRYKADEIGSLLQNDIILISLESLLKLQGIGYANNAFDVHHYMQGKYILVLDEVTETLANCFRETVKDQTAVFAYLTELVRYAGKVMTLSDDLTFWAIRTLCAIRTQRTMAQRCLQPQLPALYYELTTRTLIHDAYFTFSQSLAEQSLRRDLKVLKKNILVLCGLKSMAQYLHEQLVQNADTKILRPDECLLITSEDNPGYFRTTSIDSWQMYRCVILSPKITSGISFDKPHFHRAYCFVWEQLPVVMYKQMIARSRVLLDNLVVYAFDETLKPHPLPATQQKPTRIEELERLLLHSTRLIQDKIVADIAIPSYTMIVEETTGRAVANFMFPHFKELFFNIVIDRHRDLNSFLVRFYKHIIVDCKNRYRDASKLICFEQGVFLPTAKHHALIDLNRAVHKKKMQDQRYEHMLVIAEQLRQRILNDGAFLCGGGKLVQHTNRLALSMRPLVNELNAFKVQKTVLTPEELIRRDLYHLLVHCINPYVFLDHYKSVVYMAVYQQRKMFSPRHVQFWNYSSASCTSQLLRICRRYKAGSVRQNIAIDQMTAHSNVTPHIVLEVLCKLYILITGDESLQPTPGYGALIRQAEERVEKSNYPQVQNTDFEDADATHADTEPFWKMLVHEIYSGDDERESESKSENNVVFPVEFLKTCTRGEPFFYNPYAQLNPSERQWIQDNIPLFRAILKKFGSDKQLKTMLYGHVNPAVYLYLRPAAGSAESNSHLVLNPQSDLDTMTMVVPVNLFVVILRKVCGISVKKKRHYMYVGSSQWPAFSAPSSQRYTSYAEFVEHFGNGMQTPDSTKCSLYDVWLDRDELVRRLFLSKELFPLVPEQDVEAGLIIKPVLDAVDQNARRVEKRKRSEEEIVNITTEI